MIARGEQLGRVHNKIALVTGGASGIGLATVKLLRDEGAEVTIADLEGCVALEQILDLPPIQRAGPEEWYPGRTVRQLRCLPVQVKKTRSIDA